MSFDFVSFRLVSFLAPATSTPFVSTYTPGEMIEERLLKPGEVDLLMRYPRGRSARLAQQGRLPHILLPDGEIRFSHSEIQNVLRQARQPAPHKESRRPG